MAFSNLLDNAIKFTLNGGEIVVKVHTEEDILEISVINTFEILNEEDLINIFEPFHRTNQIKTSGSGLGLAITKKIIERLDGTISALNAPEGLEIRIILPAAPPEK